MIALRNIVISATPPDKSQVWIKPSNGKYEMYIFSLSKGTWVRISGGAGGGGNDDYYINQIKNIKAQLDEANAKYDDLEGSIYSNAVIRTYDDVKSGAVITAPAGYQYITTVEIDANPAEMTKPSFTTYNITASSSFLQGSTQSITASCSISKGWSKWQNVKVVLVHNGVSTEIGQSDDGTYSYTENITETQSWSMKILYSYNGKDYTFAPTQSSYTHNFTFGYPLYYGYVKDSNYPDFFDESSIEKLSSSYKTSASLGSTKIGEASDYEPVFALPSDWACTVDYFWAYSTSFGWYKIDAVFKNSFTHSNGKTYNVYSKNRGDSVNIVLYYSVSSSKPTNKPA